MKRIVNECMHCTFLGLPCVNCGKKRLEVIFCDVCENECEGEVFADSEYRDLCGFCFELLKEEENEL